MKRWASLITTWRESSPLRKVSLTRLERVMAKRLAESQGIDDVMRNLAGLTRVEYVFCYPETGDIVLAGPAEAWGRGALGTDAGHRHRAAGD